MNAIWQLILRVLTRRDSAIPALLAGVLVCTIAGISQSARDAPQNMMLASAVSGCALAWLAAGGRMRDRSAGALLGTLGALGLWMTIGRLDQPLLPVLALLARVPLQQVGWTDAGVLPDYSALAGAVHILLIKNAGLAAHLAARFGAMLHGQMIPDPTVRALIWSLSVWLIAAWGGWALRRHNQALLAALPAIILLAGILDYTRRGYYALVLAMAMFLLLISLNRYESWVQRWNVHGVDYSDSISFDTGMSIAIVTLGLTALATLTPSLSVRAMMDYIRDHTRREQGEGTVARSLGLQPGSSEFSQYTSPGLPNLHLIGDPPELQEQVVMRVRILGLPIIPDTVVQLDAPFFRWRSLSYSLYTGSGWTTSPTWTAAYEPGSPLVAESPAFDVIDQEITRADSADRQIFWVGTLLDVDQPLQAAWRSGEGQTDPIVDADLFGALSSADIYRARSLVPIAGVRELRAASEDYPDVVRQRYLQLPERLPARVLDLARELTGPAATPYDRALAIESYLRTFPYTLDVPQVPIGRDVSDYFLFDLKRGYCDYYATAMVVLARAAGLPARLVSGYASGAYDSSTGEYVIRNENAHAWPEVYFTGIGWIEFEPTAAMPAIERAGSSRPSTQGALPPAPQKQGPWISWWPAAGWLARLVGWVAAGAASIVILWQLAEAWILSRLPARRALAWAFRGLYPLGRRLTGPLLPGTTASEFSELLRARFRVGTAGRVSARLLAPAPLEIRTLTDAYVHSLFCARPLAPRQVREALGAWARLRWRLLAALLLRRRSPPAGQAVE